MCGLSFLYSYEKLRQSEILSFVKMNNSIIHRGPDDEGYTVIDHGQRVIPFHQAVQLQNTDSESVKAIFGFRRLSIIDLSVHGHQPMNYQDRYEIIFNGEIYNYLELQAELKSFGYSFASNTDTEVIMACYDKWGAECLNKFNGMWSFVIFDRLKNNYFISRDRFGVKPLYYYKDSHKVLFASEIKQFISFGDLNIVPNEKRILKNYYSDTQEFGIETDFTNVYRFPKASYLLIQSGDFKSQFEFKQFYNLPAACKEKDGFSESKAKILAEEYYLLLKDSVKLRLRSDVPIGTCLSGGLDSSSLAYLIDEVLKESSITPRQTSFSLVFTQSETAHCDESKFIDLVTNKLNIVNYKIEPTVKEVIDIYPSVVYHMDNIQNSSLMSYFFTYKLVKSKGVTVTIDGQGADELQAGYFTYLIHYFSNLPLKQLYRQYHHFILNTGSKKFIIQGIFFNILRMNGLKHPAKILLRSLKVKRDPYKTVNEAMREDFNENLETLLHYGDRGSMMNSVESRFPFMDYRIVEFWMKLPECFKLHGGYTKYIARRAFDKKLPDEIVWRRDKKGWEIPQYSWIRNGLFGPMNTTLHAHAFIYKIGKEDVLKKLNPAKSKNKYWKTPIKTYNTAVWHDIFFSSK